MPGIAKAFEIISTATVAKSAAEAKELLYFRATDGITMNRDRLLADAKAKALELAADYTPPEKTTAYVLPGPSAKAAMELAVEGFALQGKVTPHDKVVCAALAEVLSGGEEADISKPVGEDHVLRLEREAFMELVHTTGTIDRIEHMLLSGKPLRN